MITKKRSSALGTQQGVVLLESLIAILIFSLGILAVVGMQASLIGGASDAQYRGEASYIAQQRIGQMWSNPGNLATYLETDTDISQLLPGGLRTVTNTNPPSAIYVVTVTWQPPGSSRHQFSTTATIAGG